MPRRRLHAALALIALSVLPATSAASPAPLPDGPLLRVETGRGERIAVAGTDTVPGRSIDVWLPPDDPDGAPYAVVVMFDGQMLFDASTTWNRQAWRADVAAAAVQQVGRARPFVIVAVPNAGPARHAEYFPQKPFEALPAAFRTSLAAGRRPDGPALFAREVYSDAFARWLVEAVLPAVEARFPVSRDPDDRVVVGSSMGGLMAMYTVLEHPAAFGGFGALSTHWPGIFEMADNPIPAAFQSYVRTMLPAPGRHRLYFDHGNATLDALYPPLQAEVDRIAVDRGWRFPAYRSLAFPGEAHTEDAWAQRLPGVFSFLLPARTAETANPPSRR